MATKRHLVIYNPIAGKGKAAERIPEVEALFAERGLEYELRLTTGVWHAAELAREAAREGFGVVVAAGGDGTVNEVVNGLMLAAERGEALPAMGVLTVGRGNDFAYGADVPAELPACVEALAAGDARPMDVGRVVGGDYPKGRYFGNGIGIGFDTIVGLEAAKLKHVHGFMAYVIGALRTFIIYPTAPEVRLRHDGGEIVQKSHQISIMNGKRMGGTFFMAPQASNHDGLFDLCMAEELSRGDMIGLIARYTKGSQAGHPKIKIGRSSRFSIAAPQGGLVVHADGETICVNGSSLEIECLGGRIDLIHGSPRAPAAGAEGASRGGS
jgi:diacylglycerol kinase (ATP)